MNKGRIIPLRVTIDNKVFELEIEASELEGKVKEAKKLNIDSLHFLIPDTDLEFDMSVKDVENIINQAERIYHVNELSFFKVKNYITDMVNLAIKRKNGKLRERETEIQKIWNYVRVPRKCNAILIGPEGVGKTSITNEIARRVAVNECPYEFSNFNVYRLEIRRILNSKRNKKKIFQDLKQFFKSNKKSILIIDEMYDMLTNIYALEFFITAIKLGNIRIITTITVEDYQEVFTSDLSLLKYFNEIEVEEPDVPELLNMMKSKVKGLQIKYGVEIPKKILEFAVNTSCYLSSSNASEPEATLDTLHMAMGKASVHGMKNLDKKSILDVYDIDFKLNEKLSIEDKTSTAYHEAGHYLVGKLSPILKGRENAFVSILPIAGSLGLNADYFKLGEMASPDRNYYVNHIAYCLGGRVAEKVYTSTFSAGASSDLAMAASIAEEVIFSLGLSEESSQNRSYSVNGCLKTFLLTDELRKEINSEINEMIKEAYEIAETIIFENKGLLKTIVKKLLEEQVLTGEELDGICNENSEYEKALERVCNKHKELKVEEDW